MNRDPENSESPESEIDPGLAAAIGALPREIDPGRELFTGVRARIRTRRRRRVGALLALAAALAVMALGLRLLGGGGGASSPAPSVAEAPRAVSGSTAAVPVSAVGRSAFGPSDVALAGIRRQLRAEIEANQERLPPATRALVFENLATIDRAIAEIEKALAAEPGNAALGRTYIAYREREIDLLRQANRAAARL